MVWADEWIRRLPLYSDESIGNQDVASFKAAASSADGFVWGSPEYHGSCTGVLKNALDYLYFEQTEGKWAAIVVSAGGRSGGAGTLTTLRTVARSLHVWVPPEEVCVPSSRKALGEDGTFSDTEIQARLRSLGRHLVETVRLFRKGHTPR